MDSEAADLAAGSLDRDIQWYGHLIDEACRAEGRYGTIALLRDRLNFGLFDESLLDAPVLERATLWLLEYHIETVAEDGRRRLSLVPAHDFGGELHPPPIKDLPATVVDEWRNLLSVVTEVRGLARLRHALFEFGGAERATHAQEAADCYVASADQWSRRSDAVEDLVVATRLSRAIGDKQRTRFALGKCLELVEIYLGDDDPPAGLVGRALQHLVAEPDCPAEVDQLLERASGAWSDPSRIDSILEIMLERARKDDDKRAIWSRRIDVFLHAAELEETAVMRAVRLQRALALAEQSGDSGLRDRAASQLQTVRESELGFLSITASSRQYEEAFERLRDSMIVGDSWREAFISFANAGPLSGDHDHNREFVQTLHAQHPLASLFGTEIFGPDNMPILTVSTPEEKFDHDLVTQEMTLVSYNIRPLVSALLEIPQRHGLPSSAELMAFLTQFPSIGQAEIPAISRALFRFWAGDGEGAAFTLLPRIEAQVRTMILDTDRGI